MSVNRDPRVGDRFAWNNGCLADKVVTSVGNSVHYAYDTESFEYSVSIKEWRSDAFLDTPDPEPPAVGTEFKWNTNGRRWDDQLRKVRTVRHVDPDHDVVLWVDTDGKVGTVLLSQWEQKAQLPDSETPPEWPDGMPYVIAGHGPYSSRLTGTANLTEATYEVEPLPTGKVLLHPLREDGSRW